MITIQIKRAEKVQGIKALFITFDYNAKIVNVLRQFMIRWWHPETKEWELKYEYLDKVKELLEPIDKITIVNSYDNQFKQDFMQKEYNYIPKDYKFKIQPFKHQIEGIEYGLKYDKFLLGDEQGLGKTMQAISIACIKKKQKKYKHCLIICGVNGLKWNWKSEVEKHSDEQAYILGTRYKKNKEYIGTISDRIYDLKHMGTIKEYFIVTNIETIRNEEIICLLKLLCETNIINMLVVDEIHKCFDYDTLITTNKGDLKIGYIVENKVNCKVLSYNHKTNEFEFKPILNYFKNKVQEELIELEILGKDNKIHKIKCTKNHKIYTKNRGYIEANAITENDEILIV